MKFGMNLLLWTGDMSDSILPTLEMLKKIGYDGVEIPIFAPDEKKFGLWGKRLDDFGFERTAATIRTELSERELRVLKMRLSGELTQSEIAKRVGVSQMQVSRILRRALARLRELALAEPASR